MLVRVIEFDYNQRSLEILLLTENQIGCTESELDSGQERPGMPQVVVQFSTTDQNSRIIPSGLSYSSDYSSLLLAYI
ncbi:hypothetical protein SCA6_013026 [Theobroma cacao]